MPELVSLAPSPVAESTEGPGAVRPASRVDPGVFVRGIATLMVSQGFTWISAFVITVTMPHYLGATNLGKYAFAVALFGLTELAGDLGIGTYLNREVARDPSVAPRLITAAVASRFLLGLAAAAVLAGAFHLFSPDPVMRRTVNILAVMVVADTFALFGVALNGLLQIKWIALAQALNKLAVAALVVIALHAGYGPPGAALASLVGALVSHAINGTVLFRVKRPALAVELRLCRDLVIGGLPFLVMAGAVVVYSQIDTVMLAGLTREAVVGWYNAALRVMAIPGFVPVIVMAVAFPALAGSNQDQVRFGAIARRSIQAILVGNVPMGVGMALLPDRLTEVFHYPADFSNSWPLIVLLGLGMPLIGVDMIIGSALISCDRQMAWTKVGIAAAVLNPLVNFVAIPLTQARFGNGAIGAAAVTSLTELFMMVMGIRMLPAGTLDRSSFSGALRVLAACLPMAAVAWLTRGAPIMVPVVLGAATYAAACLATRAVTLSDLVEIRGHLLRGRTRAEAA